MACPRCGSSKHFNCGNNTVYAPASSLSQAMQDKKDGKVFSVIPTAVDKTAVVRVHPTQSSTTEIQPNLQELRTMTRELKEKLDYINGAQRGKVGTADKNANAILGLLK